VSTIVGQPARKAEASSKCSQFRYASRHQNTACDADRCADDAALPDPAFLRDAGAKSTDDTGPLWRELVRRAVALVGTPCFVISESPVWRSLSQLMEIDCGVAQRHWLSLKTQPIRPLLETWVNWGFGVEVISEFELEAVLHAGVAPEQILVNGVAKHHWLDRFRVPRLNVHYDSLAEVESLQGIARESNWSVGLRCEVPCSPVDHRPARGQFGMTSAEAMLAINRCRRAGTPVRGLHFHIGSNVRRVEEFAAALMRIRAICARASLAPEYVDIGGGLPVPGERPIDGARPAAATFDVHRFGQLLSSLPTLFPGIREVWMENGRFMTARAGVLVVKVLDRKDRNDCAFLICDGGLTNHARMASRELHDILIDPDRTGPRRKTIACGPTCATVDRLGTWSLPKSVECGDLIVWRNAGAYHIPLETRFSFGLAPIVWFDRLKSASVVRPREDATQWWTHWTPLPSITLAGVPQVECETVSN
jgi:diaminopimelate decarboxylase